MAAEPTIAVLHVASAARQSRAARLCATISDFGALNKPESEFLVSHHRVRSAWSGVAAVEYALPFRRAADTKLECIGSR